MVLGKQGFYDKLYPERYGVRADGRDLAKALADAVDRLPAEALGRPTTAAQARGAAADFDVSEAKNGSYYLKDGKLYQKQGGIGREVETKGKGSKTGLNDKDQAIVRDLIPIRDQLRAVYNWDLKAAQAKDPKFAEGRAKAEREALNEAYDAFVKKYGPINKGIFTARRPNRVQIESARRRAREEARAQGHEWDDGTFDPSDLYDSGAALPTSPASAPICGRVPGAGQGVERRHLHRRGGARHHHREAAEHRPLQGGPGELPAPLDRALRRRERHGQEGPRLLRIRHRPRGRAGHQERDRRALPRPQQGWPRRPRRDCAPCRDVAGRRRG
jgi:hypothetical protein